MVYTKRILSLLIVLSMVISIVNIVFVVTYANAGESGVKVFYGPTPINEGDAVRPNDLTIMNEYFAITIGWESSPPWGVPRGHIMDAAPIEDGVVLQDTLAQFSFLVNNWGNWINIEELDILVNTSDKVIVKASGYWEEVYGEIYYIVESGKNYMKVIVRIVNEGSKTYQLTSGFAISFKRGWVFIPGIGTARTSYGTKEERGVLDEWVAGYHEDFAIGLLSLNYTHIVSSTSWVDPLYEHTLSPGEEKTFIGYLIFATKGDLSKVLSTVNNILGRDYGVLKGSITYQGEVLDTAYVVVEKDDKVYTWATAIDSEFSIELPPGTYSVHGEARGYGPSSRISVSITAGTVKTIDISDLTQPGTVKLYVYNSETKEPLDAQIIISKGPSTPIAFLMRPAEYTDPDNIGYATLTLPPADYTLVISYGKGFLSKPVELDVSVEPGSVQEFEVPIEILVKPWESYWYSADLHHHSDILDGRTPPPYLVVAQSAAGLDFIFVSDHDSVVNHAVIKSYADKRNMPFIPSVEISPNWAHFNPYPIELGVDLLYRGTACEIFEDARSKGAIVIRANHPFVRSGYFAAWLGNYIPGGYCHDWDVAEINGRWSRDDEQTLKFMWELWNRGSKYYITAGSDTHDVFYRPYTGYPRVYAYIPKENPTPEDFALAEKNGRTFISYGPLVFTDPLPGSNVFVETTQDTIEISLQLYAVDGLQKIEVYSLGNKVYEENIEGSPIEYSSTITINAKDVINEKGFGWIQVFVYDVDGDRALTNPIWVYLAEKIPVKTTTETTTQYITKTSTYTSVATTTVVEEKTTTEIQTTTVYEPTTVTIEVIGLTTYALAIIMLLLGIGIAYAFLRKK